MIIGKANPSKVLWLEIDIGDDGDDDDYDHNNDDDDDDDDDNNDDDEYWESEPIKSALIGDRHRWWWRWWWLWP